MSEETTNSLKSLKYRNRRLVLSFLRNSGAVSVNEISRATGLSKMTIHKIIDHYLDEGLVSLTGKGESTEEGGKKPNLFSFNPDCHHLFAVRMGDDYFDSSFVNLKGETIVGRERWDFSRTPLDGVAAMIRRAFDTQLAGHSLPADSCLAMVIGVDAVVDAENGVCLAAYQYPDWGLNIPIRDSLRQVMPPAMPVHVDSWWRHMAHGEISANPPEIRRRFFLIGNSGNHVSGGLVYDGNVSAGAAGIAGEIGHMIVAPGLGRPCVCGGHGCLEALVAPARLVARAGDLRDQFPESRLFADPGLGFRRIVEAAGEGDRLALFLLEEAAGHFAVAINNIVQICDPGSILLYGDYARAGDHFLECLREKSRNLTLKGVDKRTRIARAALGDDSGVVGAANYISGILCTGQL